MTYPEFFDMFIQVFLWTAGVGVGIFITIFCGIRASARKHYDIQWFLLVVVAWLPLMLMASAMISAMILTEGR